MVGRVRELEILSNACKQNESKLIAIYGRRRVGKTYLINHMFKKYALKGKYDVKLVMLTSYGCQKNTHYNSLNIASDIKLAQLM